MHYIEQRYPRLDQRNPWLRINPFGGSISASYLLHFAAILMLMHLHPFAPSVQLNTPQAFAHAKDTILYVVPVSEKLMVFAKISGAQGGGAAGKGTVEGKPALGASDFHRKLTAVSAPTQASNSHQLIIQPATPPDLLIKQELKIPNSILGTPLVMPREQVDIVVKGPHPMLDHPNNSADTAAPVLPAPAAGMKLASISAIKTPQMPVLSAQQTKTDGDSKSATSAPSAGAALQQGESREERSLLALSTDPGTAKIALPPGNKYGEFSISPAGKNFGSPGGSGTNAIAGTTDGISAGGDGSTGVGHAKDGGGGTDGGAMVSLNGIGAAGGGYQMMIFPVPPNPKIRKNNLLISAGPLGGGGLGVYKALPCERIFTTFLPMPAANWTLEYCTARKPSAKAARNSGAVVQLEEAVAPPAPLQTFDFRRPPISDQNAPKNLILKGSIREDGTVSNLQIYQGVMREFDELAKATFNLWKFMPATRAGKPVSVEILVGIPSNGKASN
jgi:hypothetical protein